MIKLNSDNYTQGFLIDEEYMAGITEDPPHSQTFIAFVLQHTTGEYLGYQPFSDLDSALKAINQIPRNWIFEQIGGCGSQGQCSGEKCSKKKKCKSNHCHTASQNKSQNIQIP